ncbi:translation initiation factor IF-2 [SAR86 cluster bacterium]|nr:translation initiation factor IF-2 [SAR86 cluster bacterium]
MKVSQIAKAIGYSPEELLLQIKAAGLTHKNADEEINNEDKKILLNFIKSSKKASKKTISLKKTTNKAGVNSKVSITRLNQNKDAGSSEISKDFSGTIDFDDAERKRLSAEKSKEDIKDQSVEEKNKGNLVRRIKKSETSLKENKPVTSKKTNLTLKDSKKNKRELEGEKYLETKLSANVQSFEKPSEFIQKEVKVPDFISVADLAKALSIKSADLIKSLMTNGVMVTLNQTIDQETALLVVEELGHLGIPLEEKDEEENLIENLSYDGEEEGRDPIVSVLGHVDHGKTSILDFIRKSSIADSEEGGITQRIGAYQTLHNNKSITFIDTPGHAAFSQMRARGANLTDIVILVVAADDSVQPQTQEALDHAKAAEVEIIVAINKVDKPDADIDKVKGDLAAIGLTPEDWGGDTQMISVSAMTGEGIEDLLDSILLVAEVLELKTNHSGPAAGLVLESGVKKGEGAVATLLVKKGKLETGDLILVGDQYRKIRSLKNSSEENIKEALPSQPVSISGLEYSPNAGDEFIVVEDEKAARALSENRSKKIRDKRLAQRSGVTTENLFANVSNGEKSSVNLVLKSDTNGSLEALVGSINNLKVDEVNIKIVLDSVGPISENDVNLAIASDASVFGFNVRADTAASNLAEEEGISIKYFGIIYDLIDEIKSTIEGSLSPEIKENIKGVAKVKDVFKSPKFGFVAGSIVEEGTISANMNVRVLRDNIVIHEGILDSLRRFKDEVREVKSGTECGIGISNYSDIKIGDKIEVFHKEEIKRKI